MGLAQGSCAQKEFQIYVTCAVDLGFLTLFFIKMTPVVKKLTHDIQ